MSVSTLLTEEEFLELPDYPGKQELLDGELIELPPAKYFHSEMAKRLTGLLETVLPKPRVWIETAFRLRSGRWLVPDVSVSYPDQPKAGGWLQQSPMLAVEIVSRGNRASDIDKKVIAYLEDGASEIWIVYPETRGMVVFRPDSTVRVAGDSDYRCELFGITVTPEFRTPAE